MPTKDGRCRNSDTARAKYDRVVLQLQTVLKIPTHPTVESLLRRSNDECGVFWSVLFPAEEVTGTDGAVSFR